MIIPLQLLVPNPWNSRNCYPFFLFLFFVFCFARLHVKMASLKLDNYLKAFRGRGDDFMTFWDKFQVVCAVQAALDDGEKRMKVFRLFLEGDAFHLFSQMSELDKKNEEKVEAVFETAYSVTPAPAQTYCLFERGKGEGYF